MEKAGARTLGYPSAFWAAGFRNTGLLWGQYEQKCHTTDTKC